MRKILTNASVDYGENRGVRGYDRDCGETEGYIKGFPQGVFLLRVCSGLIDDESVVGIVEAAGELFFFYGMQSDLVAHVYEVSGYVRAEAAAEGDGVLYGLVRLVWRMSQGSDDE